MPINLQRIESLLSQIKESHAFLDGYRRRPVDAVLSEADSVAAVKYQLVVAIQACIDLCNHLSAQLFTRAPTDYADCFRILAESQAIPRELLPSMVRLAKLRNLLVHLYSEVDDRRLLSEMSANLDDLVEYAEAIHGYVQAQLRAGDR